MVISHMMVNTFVILYKGLMYSLHIISAAMAEKAGFKVRGGERVLFWKHISEARILYS
jgi:hypothetical protein